MRTLHDQLRQLDAEGEAYTVTLFGVDLKMREYPVKRHLEDSLVVVAPNGDELHVNMSHIRIAKINLD